MSLLGALGKPVSQVVSTIAALPRGQLNKLPDLMASILNNSHAIATIAQLDAVVSKLIDQKTTGLSSQQKQSLAVLLQAGIANQLKKRPNKPTQGGPDTLSQILAQQQALLQHITTQLQQLYSTNLLIIENLR